MTAIRATRPWAKQERPAGNEVLDDAESVVPLVQPPAPAESAKLPPA
jgi:hypothetical protein